MNTNKPIKNWLTYPIGQSKSRITISIPIHILIFPQECLWFNCLLCHIRQNLHDLHVNLVGGPGALPWELKEIVTSLAKEQVPAAWVHPNCQPSTHSLSSWIQGQYLLSENFSHFTLINFGLKSSLKFWTRKMLFEELRTRHNFCSSQYVY